MYHGLKCKTIKFTEKKTGENFHDLGLHKEFLDLISKEQYIKGKSDKMNLIKIKDV